MEITGKVHCFFEQSGTFKNEFIKLGIPAKDYDIQNNFGQTDHVTDLFKTIEDAYDGKPSLFDNIRGGDLIIAFFPCIYFCDAKTLIMKGENIAQKKWSIAKKMRRALYEASQRNNYHTLLLKLCAIADERELRLIIENPWNVNGQSFLQQNFIKPQVIDRNRMLRGDFFTKPTAYWFIGCDPTEGYSFQNDKERKIIMKCKRNHAGLCSEERSMISPDYARNFICDFILGKEQKHTIPTLF